MQRRKAGLIGQPLGHSLSPRIHEALGGDYRYDLFPLEPGELASFVRTTARGLTGFNVTIPYKKEIIPFLDDLSPVARRVGAVNTVCVAPDGRLVGHNTDYAGLASLLAAASIGLAGKKVLLLGTGGAAAMARVLVADQGARSLVEVSRHPADGQEPYEGIAGRHPDAEVVINATPVGMFPRAGATPLPLDGLDRLEAVVDLVYNPARTALLLNAERRDVRAVNGLHMLVAQASEAARLFTGTAPAPSRTDAVRDEIAFERLNIVLTGMPGAGKSAVARKLARLFPGRPVVDTDAEIERRAGMPIPGIFRTKGEKAFRDLESEVVAEIGARGGQIVATGGGAVLRPANVDALKQNGRIFFLDRDLRKLARGGRPLAPDDEALRTLYEERLPVYRSTCDDIVDANDDRTDEAIDRLLRPRPGTASLSSAASF